MMKHLTGYIVEKYNNMTGAYTCHRLLEEGRKEGVDLTIVGVHDCCVSPSGIVNSSIKLDCKDIVINRYKWGVIKDEINKLAEKSYNRIDCYDIYKNKYEQLKRLRSEYFNIPSYLLATSMMPYHCIEQIIKPPFVAKALENSMGREIFLIEDEEQYLSLRKNYSIDREWLFEEFISSSIGKDLRLFSIRGRAVACMMRESQGDFRANVALGAKVKKMEITPEMERIADDIYRQTGLDFVGIDLLFSPIGFYLCEINVMPGLEGIESATGINVAGQIIRMIKEDFRQ